MSATRLEFSLFLLRLGIFAVMATWTADKFINPDHTSGVWQRFYHINNIEPETIYIVGVLQALVVAAFGLGLFKGVSYALVTLMHAIYTVSTWEYLINPYANNVTILFMTSIPMLAACIALYLMRVDDRFLAVSK